MYDARPASSCSIQPADLVGQLPSGRPTSSMSFRPMSACSFSGPCSPAASLLFAKFQALDAHNKELLAENYHLRDQLDQAEEPSSPSDGRQMSQEQIGREIQRRLSADSMELGTFFQEGIDFDTFCQRVGALGIDVEWGSTRQALEDLFSKALAREVAVTKRGSRLLQEYSVVKVYLLAKIAGVEHCLIEHDRFDLRNGRQKSCMLPVEIRMRTGETWQQAARRGLQTMVGLDAEWQDSYVTFDESSHICTNDDCADEDNPLDFLVSASVHEIHGRLRSFAEGEEKKEAAAYEQIGLPIGRDFVYCQESRSTVHVWCWKCREHERSGRLKMFERYLQDHNIDTSLFGTGDNETLFQFYQETKEHKHCTLREDKGQLTRVVQMLKIKLIAEVNNRKRVLMENEQEDGPGRKQSDADKKVASGEFIVKKLREGEDWRESITETIAERIGVSAELQSECFSIDFSKMLCTEELVESQGFASMMCNYVSTTVTVYITSPDNEQLDVIGLPRGNDFVSKESTSMGGEPDLHVWTWMPETNGQDDGGYFGGTALEVLNRDLYDVERILAQTATDAELIRLGLDKPFVTSLQKIRQCTERLSDIDKMLKTVDVNGIMGADADSRTTSQDGTQSQDMSGIKSFIEANFIRTQEEGPKTVPGKTKGKFSNRALADGNIGCLSLERIFDSAPSRLKSIMEGRNSWDFDFFAAAASFESPSMMLEGYGEIMVVPFCVDAFGCTEEAAHGFVTTASSQYLDNPYHGPIHAAQVCHLARWLTKAMRIMEQQGTLESTAFMLAAFCHDIKHIGRNNNFCMMSEHPLSLLYNNSSVLENFHSSTCLELLESMLVLKNLPRKERASVRSHIIENILATDMAEHFETISKFRVRREAHDFSIEVEADRRFVARLCLKSGDLGHACLPWELHVEWATRVTMEFYAQGDEEKRLGLPMSALCDRKDVGNIAQSQKGFLGFVVTPIYRALSDSQPAPYDLSNQCDNGEEDDAVKMMKAASCVRRGSNIVTHLEFQIAEGCMQNLQSNSKHWEDDWKTVKKVQKALNPMFEDDGDDSSDLGENDDRCDCDDDDGNHLSEGDTKAPSSRKASSTGRSSMTNTSCGASRHNSIQTEPSSLSHSTLPDAAQNYPSSSSSPDPAGPSIVA